MRRASGVAALVLVASTAASSARDLPYETIAPPGEPRALVIALHGAASTARFFCGTFFAHQLEVAAALHGFLVVCPAGVGPAPKYEKYEAELLALREAMLVRYPTIRRVFVLGHSLGGRGAWWMGLKHPDSFDALGVIAPATNLVGDKFGRVKHLVPRLRSCRTPTLLAYAKHDHVVRLSRKNAERLREAAGCEFELRAYDANHVTIAAASIHDVMVFFARHALP